MVPLWAYFRAIAWILITMAFAYACFCLWSFVWASFFKSTIAVAAVVLAVYLTFITLLIGAASFSQFVSPILDARAPAIKEEER